MDEISYRHFALSILVRLARFETDDMPLLELELLELELELLPESAVRE